MWANAQRDGRPAEYRWRPLFNAAKFGWRPLLEWMCRAVTLPRRESRWNLLGCPKLTKRSQPLVSRSSPYYHHYHRLPEELIKKNIREWQNNCMTADRYGLLPTHVNKRACLHCKKRRISVSLRLGLYSTVHYDAMQYYILEFYIACELEALFGCEPCLKSSENHQMENIFKSLVISGHTWASDEGTVDSQPLQKTFKRADRTERRRSFSIWRWRHSVVVRPANIRVSSRRLP